MVGFNEKKDVNTQKKESVSLREKQRQKVTSRYIDNANHSEATGATALRLNSSFHERVLLIKKHLE